MVRLNILRVCTDVKATKFKEHFKTIVVNEKPAAINQCHTHTTNGYYGNVRVLSSPNEVAKNNVKTFH